MKNYKLKIIIFFGIILAFFLLPKISWAADFYIAQNQAGSNDGSNCSNAKAVSWFNTAGNWVNPKSSGKIGPGDTVHLCGTFTGTAGGRTLSIQGSGTAGAVITILAEPGVIFTSPWADSHIYCSGKQYLIIDGGMNGVIKNTDNGVGKTYQEYSSGIDLQNCNNTVVKNWTIQDMYTHAQNEAGGQMWGVAVDTWYGSNITIENNTISNTCFGIDIVYRYGESNITVQNNTISYFNIAIHVASANVNSTISNVQILNNIMHDTVNWDDPSNNYHHNAIHAYAVHTGSSISGLTIAGNYVYGAWSTTGHNTSAFYIEPSPGTATNVLIYNNLIAPSQYYGGNAFIYCKSGGTPSVYNNTIVGTGPNHAMQLDGGGIVKGNIIIGVDAALSQCGGTVTSDYNSFYQVSADRPYCNLNLTDWQSSGKDTNSLTSNSNLDVSYKPQVSSPVKDAFPTAQAPTSIFTTDKAGTARPQGSAWDIGAYEYVDTADTTPPAAPTGVTVN